MAKGAVYGKLGAARKAKKAGDLDGSAAALHEAIGLARDAGEDKLLCTASWRLADMLREAGRPEDMLKALDVVVAHGKPFAHLKSAKAWETCNQVVRNFWDFAGYDTERLLPLFKALQAHYEADSDPYMAAQADELAAWQMACRGDLEGMTALLDTYAPITPKQFGSGKHRHPRASPGQNSIYWVQMEIARTAVRMAAWMGEEEIGLRAYELHLKAARSAGQRQSEFPHFLEAAMIAAIQFGWEEVLEASRDDYDKAVRSWSGGRVDYHQGVRKAITFALAGQASEAADAWRDVATVSDEMHYGPEWVGDYLLRGATAADEAGRGDDARKWRAQAAEVIDEYGFDAMRARIS